MTRVSHERAHLCQSFQRAGQSYDGAARVQGFVAHGLFHRMAKQRAFAQAARVLELGCGSGQLTRRIARLSLQQLYLNDLYRHENLADIAPQARFLGGDFDALEVPRDLDVILSSSAFQWSHDPARLLARLAGALGPGGWIGVTSYGPGQFSELAALGFGAVAPGLCAVEHLRAALPHDIAVIEAASCKIVRRFDSPRAVLRHLRATGVNGQRSAVWTKRDLAAFEAGYRALSCEGSVCLTYHPTWLIARKCP